MATQLEELKWNLYQEQYRILFDYGSRNGLVRPYDKQFIQNLRRIDYGGLPASILLLHHGLSNGYCYDRGPLVTLGFGEDLFQVVNADVDTLRLKPEYIDENRMGIDNGHYANHCFAERTLQDGTTWVYDTSLGLIIEKSLYYHMEHPRVTKVNDKKTTWRYLYNEFLSEVDMEKEKYMLPFILPQLEAHLVPIQPYYLDMLKEEIALLKQAVHYDDLCQEIQEDMKVKEKVLSSSWDFMK